MGLLAGLVGRYLGKDEIALMVLINYWHLDNKSDRWTEHVKYELPSGKSLTGLSLSPAPTGVKLVLASMDSEYFLVVRDDENKHNSPFFRVGSWTDEPAGIWAKTDEVLRSERVIRSAYARGRSRDDRFTTMCDLLQTWAGRGDITDWAVDLGVGDGFWIKGTNGAEMPYTLDVWWEHLTKRPDWPPHL